VEGHADSSGTPEANQTLSQSRAEAARDYLMSKGVSADLLLAVGMGSTALADPEQPLSPKNRRVEIGRAQAPVSP
jgi:OmpA-OmpF porin, OOP family